MAAPHAALLPACCSAGAGEGWGRVFGEAAAGSETTHSASGAVRAQGDLRGMAKIFLGNLWESLAEYQRSPPSLADALAPSLLSVWTSTVC